MNTNLILGLGWFVFFYILSSIFTYRTEQILDEESKDLLKKARQPLKPIVFIFVVGILYLIYRNPAYIWLWLILGETFALSGFNWYLRRLALPQSFKDGTRTASILHWVGIAGLSLVLWNRYNKML